MRWALFIICLSVLVACNSGNKKNALPQHAPPVQIDSTVYINNSFQSLIDEYEDPKRRRWQNPALVLDKLGNLSNKKVADIGAGTGYFTFRMAQRGADVIAIDIEEQFLNYIDERKEELLESFPEVNVETRLAKPEDPLLNTEEVDLILMVNTYHFIEDRVAYLQKLRRAIRKGGEVFIVDYKVGMFPVGPTEELKISVEQVKKEIKEAGLEITQIDMESLDYQYIIVMTK